MGGDSNEEGRRPFNGFLCLIRYRNPLKNSKGNSDCAVCDGNEDLLCSNNNGNAIAEPYLRIGSARTCVQSDWTGPTGCGSSHILRQHTIACRAAAKAIASTHLSTVSMGRDSKAAGRSTADIRRLLARSWWHRGSSRRPGAPLHQSTMPIQYGCYRDYVIGTFARCPGCEPACFAPAGCAQGCCAPFGLGCRSTAGCCYYCH
ncbi:hypothetical protein ACJJTC_003885 [Scirpophaga incertulas]